MNIEKKRPPCTVKACHLVGKVSHFSVFGTWNRGIVYNLPMLTKYSTARLHPNVFSELPSCLKGNQLSAPVINYINL